LNNNLQIQEKVISLIQKWGLRFQNDSDILPLFSQVYLALKNKGVPFPPPEVASS